MFIPAGYLHDPQAERRDAAARERVVLALVRARRLRRWARRSARLAEALARQARSRQIRAV